MNPWKSLRNKTDGSSWSKRRNVASSHAVYREKYNGRIGGMACVILQY